MKSLEKINGKIFVSMDEQMLDSFKGGQAEGTVWECVESTDGGKDTQTTYGFDGRWSHMECYHVWENNTV